MRIFFCILCDISAPKDRKYKPHPTHQSCPLETDRPVIVAQQALTKATEDFQRLQERADRRAEAQQAALRVKAGCEEFLRDGVPGGCKLEAVEVEVPKPAKGENGLLDQIESRRRRVRELRADLHRIASAPYPSAYCKQRMREQIKTLAMQGAPSVSALIELDGPVGFPTQNLTSEVHGERRSLAFTETADALALIAWLHRDALIAALDREIASEADDKSALTHEQRQQRESEVQADLLSVERDESWFVWQAQSQGLPVERRADISPLALLGLKLVTTPRADGTPPTTPGYSWSLRR